MKKIYLRLTILATVLLALLTSYVAWNRLDPNFTCSLCHEIRPSTVSWCNSAHANISCNDCHGTALSDGFSSLTEKVGMVYTHFTRKITNEDIYLNESQALAITDNCVDCHQAEYYAWRSGAHSTTYSDIFMDEAHNETEKPYWGCFRCHGAFYDGNIYDLMSLEGDAASWKIKDDKRKKLPTIICLSCHQMHGEQDKRIDYALLDSEEKESLMQKTESPSTALYIRAEKRHIPSSMLIKPTIYSGDSIVSVSNDPNTWLCMQCHAPNYKREQGTEDDKTPTGIYEGMSCLDCHNPHSTGLKNDYRDVHISH